MAQYFRIVAKCSFSQWEAKLLVTEMSNESIENLLQRYLQIGHEFVHCAFQKFKRSHGYWLYVHRLIWICTVHACLLTGFLRTLLMLLCGHFSCESCSERFT